MRLNEFITSLQALQEELGDVEVLVTDGFDAKCYRGDYAFQAWQDDSGQMYADIGIGGCLEE